MIYPGIGFGAVLAQAKTISDKMIVCRFFFLFTTPISAFSVINFLMLETQLRLSILSSSLQVAAARTLAKLSPALEDPRASLLPAFEDSKSVNFTIALAVWEAAIEEGVARKVVDGKDRKEFAEKKMWSMFLSFVFMKRRYQGKG